MNVSPFMLVYVGMCATMLIKCLFDASPNISCSIHVGSLLVVLIHHNVACTLAAICLNAAKIFWSARQFLVPKLLSMLKYASKATLRDMACGEWGASATFTGS